jgi:hypothetical protein
MENPKINKNRAYFGGPPSQSAEIRHLFLDFGLSINSKIYDILDPNKMF